MSEISAASDIVVTICEPDCPCQSIHLVLTDEDGFAFAVAAMSPASARALAADIRARADEAEARSVRNAGRLT